MPGPRPIELHLLLLGGVLLAACFSTHRGTRITPEQKAVLVEGTTTAAEVVRAWGEPTGTTRESDGTVTLVYSLSRLNYTLLAPTHSETDSVILKFGGDGKLLRWEQSHAAPKRPRWEK